MPDLIDIRMPSEQQEGTSSTFARWLVQPGEAVDAHQPVAEIETDKVMVEIAAPAAGVLRDTLKAEGDAVEPGELLGRLAPGATARKAASQPAGTVPRRSVSRAAAGGARLSPAVRRMLEQYGLDASQIQGSGRSGRITTQDVQAFVETRDARASAPAPAGAALPPSRRVPHDPVRRRIAAHMVESLLRTAPHVTSVFQADLTAVLAHREAHKQALEKQGARLTLTAYFVAASCRALQKVPEVNSRFHDDYLEIFEDLNVGVGTALEGKGLIVPVIQRAQTLDLAGIARALTTLTDRARSGTLAPEEVRGGTFTISNHGVSGSLVAAPIVIVQPQSAILGVGKLEKRVIVVEQDGSDTLAIRPMVYLTLSIDHRALDAYQANAFLTELVRALETWSD